MALLQAEALTRPSRWVQGGSVDCLVEQAGFVAPAVSPIDRL